MNKNNRTRKNKKINKINCGPIKRNKTLKQSCFDDNTLFYLKKIINKYNDQISIQSNRPKKIWYEIKTKIPQCNNEQCWLKHINNKELVKKINNHFFAPKQPKKWKTNKHTWLWDRDIFDVLNQYDVEYKDFNFIGPTPIDFDSSIDIFHNCVNKKMCSFSIKNYLKKNISKIGIVFNLDKHTQNGSHWTSMFINLDENFIYYMDSAAMDIPDEVHNFVERLKQQNKDLNRKELKFYTNIPLEHQKGDSECGMYSLYFIITMLTKKTEDRTFKNYQDIIDYFSNKRITDKFVFNYRDKYFNK